MSGEKGYRACCLVHLFLGQKEESTKLSELREDDLFGSFLRSQYILRGDKVSNEFGKRACQVVANPHLVPRDQEPLGSSARRGASGHLIVAPQT